MVEIGIFWLPILGGILLGSVAVSAYFSGQFSLALWTGFFGLGCFLMVGAIQIQQAIWSAPPAGPGPGDISRAFVFVEEATLTNVDDDLATIGPDRIPSVRVVIRNSGQTPALKVIHRIHARLAAYPPQAEIFAVSTPQPDSVFNLAPGDRGTGYASFGRPLTVDEKTLLGLGTLAAYVFGEISYDAFGIRRCTHYRFIAGGNVGFNNNHMAQMRDGNEADQNCTKAP